MLRTASQESSLSGLRAAEVIARRAGVTGMIAGQTLDVTLEGTEPTLEKVAYIHAHKTADSGRRLPWRQACCWLGHRRSSWRRDGAHGYHLGLAFQMVDDLLDLEGDPALLGKNVGMDATLGKLTWPSCVGEAQTRAEAAEHIDEAVKALAIYEEKANFLKGLAQSTLTRVQ